MHYVILNKITRQPLGLVRASDERTLFDGMANLSDESGVPLQHLEAVDLSAGEVVPTPEWAVSEHRRLGRVLVH